MMDSKDGVLPLARKLGELLPSRALEIPPEIQMIATKPVRLSPERWGFKTEAEMNAAFAAEIGEDGDD